MFHPVAPAAYIPRPKLLSLSEWQATQEPAETSSSPPSYNWLYSLSRMTSRRHSVCARPSHRPTLPLVVELGTPYGGLHEPTETDTPPEVKGMKRSKSYLSQGSRSKWTTLRNVMTAAVHHEHEHVKPRRKSTLVTSVVHDSGENVQMDYDDDEDDECFDEPGQGSRSRLNLSANQSERAEVEMTSRSRLISFPRRERFVLEEERRRAVSVFEENKDGDIVEVPNSAGHHAKVIHSFV